MSVDRVKTLAAFLDSVPPVRGLIALLGITLMFGISIGVAGQSSFSVPGRMTAVEETLDELVGTVEQLECAVSALINGETSVNPFEC